MNILKRENWWMWLLILLLSHNVGIIILAGILGILNKDAWYANWKNWLIAFLCLVFPVFIMFAVFSIQLTVEVAAKLNVPGKEIYATPYIWILCVIIPIIGWLALGAMSIYLFVNILIALYNGEAEQYI